MSTDKRFTNATGAPVADNTNIMTAGRRGPALLQDIWLIEKLAHFDREVIPERRMHAKGWGAYGTFTVTHDITRYTKAKIFSKIGKQTPMFARFSTVAGERGAADAERDIRGTALKFYTEEGNWDIVGNNTPVFFFRDPLRFSDLNHAIKRDPRTGLRSADNNWDFWTLLPEALHQVTIVMSDRGIPKSFRNMHLFGSHTFSMINAANERVWVKFHFRTQQGIAEPHRRRGRGPRRQGSRKPRPRPAQRDRGGRLPALDALHSGDDRGPGEDPSAQSLRPDQGLAEGGVSADRGRRDGAQPLPGQLFSRKWSRRPSRPPTSCPASAFRRTRCSRDGCSPMATPSATGSASTSTTSRSTRPNARSKATIATARCAPTAIWAERSLTIPTAQGFGTTSPISPSRRCRSRATRRIGTTASTTTIGSSPATCSGR